MEKPNLYRIVAIASIALVLLIPMGQTATIFGQPVSSSPAASLPPAPPLQTDSVNAVAIRAVFHFGNIDETVDSFKEFQTNNAYNVLSTISASGVAGSNAPTSGFVSQSPTPSFIIRGVINWDRPNLYEKIDSTFANKGAFTTGDYPEFDVDIWFHHSDQYYRGLNYAKCHVTDYQIDTLRDNDKPYTTKIGGGDAGQKFVYRESITFTCVGLKFANPVLAQMQADKQAEESEKIDQMMREKFPERYK